MVFVVSYTQGIKHHLVEEEQFVVHHSHIAVEPCAYHAVGLVVLRYAVHRVYQQLRRCLGRILSHRHLLKPATTIRDKCHITLALCLGDADGVAQITHQGIHHATVAMLHRYLQHIHAVVVCLGVDGLFRHIDGHGRQPLAGVTVGDTSAKGQIVLLSRNRSKGGK